MSANTNKRTNYIRSANNYVRYSGMAFEMLIIIAAGVWGGIKLDERLQTQPVFAIIGSLAGIAIALYVVIKDSLHQNLSDHGKKDTD